jgi:hypothetical protein
LVAPGGSPDADRFRPLRSGRSTSSLTKALLIQKVSHRRIGRPLENRVFKIMEKCSCVETPSLLPLAALPSISEISFLD